jgi:hypothetical protein
MASKDDRDKKDDAGEIAWPEITCMQTATRVPQAEKAHNKLNVTIRNITLTGRNNEDVGVVLVTLIHLVGLEKVRLCSQ